MTFARLEVPDAPDNDGIAASSPTLANPEPVRVARFDGDHRVPDHVDAPGIDSFDGDGVARGRLGVGDHGVDLAHRETSRCLAVPRARAVDIYGRSSSGHEHGHPGKRLHDPGKRVGGHQPRIDDVDVPGKLPILPDRLDGVAEAAMGVFPTHLATKTQHVHWHTERLSLTGQSTRLREDDEPHVEQLPG